MAVTPPTNKEETVPENLRLIRSANSVEVVSSILFLVKTDGIFYF